MDLVDTPFGTTNWSLVPATEHAGESGHATWRTWAFGSVRVRIVEYSPGYVADHWCTRGHMLLVLEGTLTTELASGEVVTIDAGSSYQVADDTEPHRSRTEGGARLFVVD